MPHYQNVIPPRPNFSKLGNRQKDGRYSLKVLNFIRFAFLIIIILLCFMLLYYSATKPFTSKKHSSSVSLKAGKESFKEHLLYQSAQGAYAQGDYEKANDLIFKASSSNFNSKKLNALSKAIEEALMLKKRYSTSKNLGFTESFTKIINQDSHRSSKTLEIYQTIQTFLNRAKRNRAKGKYGSAISFFKKAFHLAQKNDFETKEILSSLKTLEEEFENFKEKIKKKKETHALHLKQAQFLYKQAVIFEAMPDIEAAKIKWETILSLLEPNTEYYQKAQRKLLRYTSF